MEGPDGDDRNSATFFVLGSPDLISSACNGHSAADARGLNKQEERYSRVLQSDTEESLEDRSPTLPTGLSSEAVGLSDRALRASVHLRYSPTSPTT